MAKVNCIDVSYCQKNIDFNAVKADGIKAVIIRAGYGRETYQKDSQFESHYKNAKAAGLKVGAYWYSHAESISDARTEAQACLSILNGRKFDMPVYYDMEDGSQTGYGKAKLTSMAEAFCEEIKKGGYRAGIYANYNWFKNYLDLNYLKSKYYIWLAQYASAPDLDCGIWQKSSTGRINGISGDVDVNVIFNSKIFDGADTPNTQSNTISAKKSSVKDVQIWLNNFYEAGLAVDGIYGTKTKTALIKALQDSLNHYYGAGLTVDGIFRSKTKSAVRNLYKGHSGSCTRALQGLLICNGYDIAFDGVYGSETEQAVKDFQNDHGLTADGIAGRNTFQEITA